MSKRAATARGDDIAEEAARIVCEEAVTDYHAAKLRAAQRLGLGPRATLPENARVEQAVLAYQALFGGEDYRHRLQQLRQAARQALRLLAPFEPRLVGAVVTGAITRWHRVQIHTFADAPELVDFFLEDHHIPFRQDERNFRFPDGQQRTIPLARFEAGDVGIDLAVFDRDELHRAAPLSPTNGMVHRRLTAAEVEELERG
jgi:hypothetical protein